jgi:hypothetical protein
LVPTLSRVETVIQGYICEVFNFSTGSGANWIFNSELSFAEICKMRKTS